MTSHSKLTWKNCPNNVHDIITSLPLELKQEILARLPIQESVRTSVLSTGWRRAWTVIPRLLFHQQSGATSQHFIETIDKVLSQHKPPIFVFNLFALEFCKEALDRWIFELVNHPIEEFYIKSHGGPLYDVSFELYKFHKLKEMRLINCIINLPESFEGFKFLKHLSLKFSIVKEDELKKFVSSCPNLESLDLCILGPMISVNINSKKLQTLRIVATFKQLQMYTPFLVEACIVSRQIFADDDIFDILGQLSNGSKLRYQLFDKPEKPIPGRLNNLKCFSTGINFGNKIMSARVLSFFKSAPKLRMLLLWVEGEVIEESNDVMVKFWESNKFPVDQLTVVSMSNRTNVKGLLCSKPVLAFMKVLLEFATELKIVLCESIKDPNEKILFAHQLLKFKTASRSVHLRIA